MRATGSRIIRAVVAVGALGGVLIAATAWLGPLLLARTHVRERVVAELSRELGGPVELTALRLSAVPLPHVVLEGMRATVAPSLEASIDTIAVYPRLRALLTGSLRVARVRVIGATLGVHVYDAAAGEPTPGKGFSAKELRATVVAALGRLSAVTAARAPGLILDLQRLTATVASDGKQLLALTNIEGTVQLPPAELRIDLHGGSNLWEEASLSAALEPGAVRGDARLRVAGVRAPLLAAQLLPADWKITGGAPSIEARVRADGIDAFTADVEATVPTLPLQRSGEEFTLEGGRVSASIAVNGEKIEAAIHDIQTTNPPAQLSAKVMLDPTVPRAQFRVEGKNVDVARVHSAALFFAGGNAVARSIFDVLQAGQVPRVSVEAQAPTLAELGSLDVIEIHGNLAGGRIRLPDNGLEIEDVSGEASVVNGVLIGERAAGHVGHSQASNGSVRVGLRGAARELSVRTVVHADAHELPAMLRRLVDNETLTHILDRVTDLQGTAEGTLALGGTTDAATAEIDVPSLSLATRLRDLERTVHIEGGPFHYDPTGITVSQLRLSTDGSMLSDLSLYVDTRPPTATIDVGGGAGRIDLGELYPWVARSGWMPDSPWSPEKLSGFLNATSIRLRGPAARPGEWRIELAGSAERLDVDAPSLRRFVAVRQPVSLANLRLRRDGDALAVSTAATFADDLKATIDVVSEPSGVNIKQLSIRDAASSATLSLRIKERAFDLAFAGALDTTALKSLLADEHDIPRSLRGNFQAHVLLDEPTRSTAKGRLEVSHVAVPLPGNVRLQVAQATLHASGGLLAVEAACEIGDVAQLHVHGALRPADNAFIADVDVSTGELEWRQLADLMSAVSSGSEAPQPHVMRVPLRGTLRFTAAAFSYAGYTWRPVHAVVNLSGATWSLNVTQATLCNITTPATIAPAPAGMSIAVKALAKDQPLESISKCLFGTARVSGRGGVAAKLAVTGPADGLVRAAQGHVELSADDGRIYQGGWIEKVLAVMSFGRGSWNILKDLTDDGLPYHTIRVKGDVRDGFLVLTEATMDAPSMKMAAEGRIDLSAETLHLTLLAAPLKTVDSIVGFIPILGGVLGGSLLTIPIAVDGPVRDPAVTPMDPSAVGDGLMRVMTRIVKLPLHLLNPLLPNDDKR